MSTEAVLPTSTASPKEGPPKKKRKLSFPTAFTILFALTIVAVAATWFVPAGQYAKLAYNADAGTLQITSPQGAVSEEPATQETVSYTHLSSLAALPSRPSRHARTSRPSSRTSAT